MRTAFGVDLSFAHTNSNMRSAHIGKTKLNEKKKCELEAYVSSVVASAAVAAAIVATVAAFCSLAIPSSG